MSNEGKVGSEQAKLAQISLQSILTIGRQKISANIGRERSKVLLISTEP